MDLAYKKTVGQYRKYKDGNRKNCNSLESSFVYFVEMDAVHGTRAALKSPFLYPHVNGIRIRSRLADNRI